MTRLPDHTDAPQDVGDDARVAFLFTNENKDLYAVSLEDDGSNLPSDTHWSKIGEFPLGVQEIVPLRIAPEPILRGLMEAGYFIWKRDYIEPFGTSQ